MTQPLTDELDTGASPRRARGRARAFPALKFEEALLLPESILEYAIDGEIQRLTLFEKLNRSPDSGPSRTLINSSNRYGLTSGGYQAPALSVTDDGRVALDEDGSPRAKLEKRFELSIARFDCFNDLYHKVKNRRLPDETVLGDELQSSGVSDADRMKASEIFAANLRFLGLITEIAGSEHVRTIEEVLTQTVENSNPDAPKADDPDVQPDATLVASSTASQSGQSRTNGPALHLDIQIHIDGSASADQIELIFASMARHLYGRE